MTPPSPPSSRGLALGLVALFAAGWLARSLNAAWDAPFNYHPDEHRIYGAALRMVRLGTLDPDFFAYPSLVMTLTAIPALVMHWLSPDVPLVLVGPADAPFGWIDPSQHRFIVAGRVVVGALGAAAGPIVVAFAAGLRGANPGLAGWSAGIAAGFAPLAIEHGHYLTTDAAAGTGVAAALALAALAVAGRAPSMRWWAGVGVAVGLAAGAKYTAVVVAVPVAVACLLAQRCWATRALALVVAAAASAVTFFFTTPFLVLRAGDAYAALRGEALHYYRDGHPALGTGSRSWGELAASVASPTTFGIALVIAAAVGALTVAITPDARRRYGQTTAVLVTHIVTCSLMFGAARAWFDRSLTLLLPALAMLAAVGLIALAESAPAETSRRSGRPVGEALHAALAVALAVETFTQGIAVTARFALPRTETLARVWFDNAAPSGSHALVEWYGPRLDPARYSVAYRFTVSDLAVEALETIPVDYIVVASGSYARFVEPRALDEESLHRQRLYAALFDRPLAARFCATPNVAAGSEVRVYAASQRARALHSSPEIFGECPP